MAEPTQISVELLNGITSYVRRCCDDPVPVTHGTHWNNNTSSYRCEIKCSSCGVLLATLRWRLPAKEPAS